MNRTILTLLSLVAMTSSVNHYIGGIGAKAGIDGSLNDLSKFTCYMRVWKHVGDQEPEIVQYKTQGNFGATKLRYSAVLMDECMKKNNVRYEEKLKGIKKAEDVKKKINFGNFEKFNVHDYFTGKIPATDDDLEKIKLYNSVIKQVEEITKKFGGVGEVMGARR